MRKTKLFVLVLALSLFGMVYAAAATQKKSPVSTTDKAACCATACCQQGSCCASDACDMKKDGHAVHHAVKTEDDAKACPMKTKAAAQGASCHAEGAASCCAANCCSGDKKQTDKPNA